MWNVFGIVVILAVYLRTVNIPRYDPTAGGRVDAVRRCLLDPLDPRILVCAHRGGNPPENSLSAISRAIAMRADIVELDTAETADGHIVLMHDRLVDRTTNGRGPIARMTLAEVKRLKLRKSLTGEPPPTLEDALRFADHNVFINLDLKKGAPERIIKIVRRVGALDRVSFYGDAKRIAAIQALAPRAIVMGRLRRRADELDEVIARTHAPLISVPSKLFTPALATRIRQSGAKPWVNSIGMRDYVGFANLFVAYMPLAKAGVGVIQTDEPQMIRMFLNRYGLGVDVTVARWREPADGERSGKQTPR